MISILKLKSELPVFVKFISYILIVLSVTFSNVSLIPIILLVMSLMIVFFDKKDYSVNDFTFVTAFLILLF